MEGRGHRQQHAALDATLLGHRDGALDRALVARNHDLPRVIVVGDGADFALRPRPSASACALSISAPSSAAMAPSPTGTAACIACPRSLSSRAVVGEVERAGRAERRIFAQAVPGDEHRPCRRIETPPSRSSTRSVGDRIRHDRRLGIFGQHQLRLRPFAHQAEQVLAQRLVDFLETSRATGDGGGERLRPCRPTGCPVPER